MQEQPLSVSLVVFRTPVSELQSLFNTLSEVTDPALVCVVDNSGDSDLAEAVKQAGFVYRRPSKNKGFGAGHNLAIFSLPASELGFHLILNPDISFQPEALSHIKFFMSNHPDVVIAVPKIQYPNGEMQYLCKLFPTPIDLVVRRFLPDSWGKQSFQKTYELRGWTFDQVADIPTLSGCFMLIKASALRAVGGFDERFFLYLEDFDLCRRIGKLGRTVFIPEVFVIHHYAKGSYHQWKLLVHHCLSAIRYFGKWGWWVDKERKLKNQLCLKTLGLEK